MVGVSGCLAPSARSMSGSRAAYWSRAPAGSPACPVEEARLARVARGKGNAQLIPGWPSSLVAVLERGRTSWTLPLDAIRLGPADDVTAVTPARSAADSRSIANKGLRALMTGLLAVPKTPGQLTYDLPRLRLAGLIHRIEHTTSSHRSSPASAFPAPAANPRSGPPSTATTRTSVSACRPSSSTLASRRSRQPHKQHLSIGYRYAARESSLTMASFCACRDD